MKLKDKVVVVTGSTRGIGRAIAEECAREGAKVVICPQIPHGREIIEWLTQAASSATHNPKPLNLATISEATQKLSVLKRTLARRH